MAAAYFRNPGGNNIFPVESILNISTYINPDNSYSYKYSSDALGNQPLYISTTTYPDTLTALQAGYNALVIEPS